MKSLFTHCCSDLFNFASGPFKRVKISISSSTHLVKPSLDIAQVILCLFLFLSFACRAQGPHKNQPNHTVCTAGCSLQLGKMVAKSCWVMQTPYVKHFGYFKPKMFNIGSFMYATRNYYSLSIVSFNWIYFGRISKSQTSVKFDP